MGEAKLKNPKRIRFIHLLELIGNYCKLEITRFADIRKF
jgi:hypothetical protein